MQLSAVVCSGLAQTGVHYGLGKHMADISNGEWKIEAFKYTVIAPNFSMVSTTTGKLSVAVFLLRLMGQTASPAKRWFLYIFSVISIAWNVLAIIAIMGYCRPAEKIWRPEVPGSCFSLKFQLIAGISQACECQHCLVAMRRDNNIIQHSTLSPTLPWPCFQSSFSGPSSCPGK